MRTTDLPLRLRSGRSTKRWKRGLRPRRGSWRGGCEIPGARMSAQAGSGHANHHITPCMARRLRIGKKIGYRADNLPFSLYSKPNRRLLIKILQQFIRFSVSEDKLILKVPL